jgi:glycosyltransferase involved in cell wall biosynthesis
VDVDVKQVAAYTHDRDADRSVRPTDSLSVLIPAYNEAEILETTVRTVVAGLEELRLDWWELIICENGSSDETLPIALRLAREIPGVMVVSLGHADYGAAMRAGFLAARADVIVNFDADYYDMEFVHRALRQDAEIVVAAKSILDSEDTRAFVRRLASRTFGWFVRTTLKLRVAETHGMKLYHRRSTQQLAMAVRSTKDLFDTELIARAEWKGLSIAALPIRTVEMRHSRSGILRRVPRTIWGLCKIRALSRDAFRARVAPAPAPAAEPALRRAA